MLNSLFGEQHAIGLQGGDLGGAVTQGGRHFGVVFAQVGRDLVDGGVAVGEAERQVGQAQLAVLLGRLAVLVAAASLSSSFR